MVDKMDGLPGNLGRPSVELLCPRASRCAHMLNEPSPPSAIDLSNWRRSSYVARGVISEGAIPLSKDWSETRMMVMTFSLPGSRTKPRQLTARHSCAGHSETC